MDIYEFNLKSRVQRTVAAKKHREGRIKRWQLLYARWALNKHLMDMLYDNDGYTINELAKRFSKSRRYVKRTLA